MPEVRPFYAHEGLNVQIYDGAADTPAGDLELFLELARESGGPVLDLGCGTGRVAWPLADAGFEVTGLDVSEPMLARAEAKRARHPDAAEVRLLRQSMERFELNGSFGLALSAFRAFQALLTPEAQRGCLESVYAALRPGGRIVLTLFDPLLDKCTPEASADALRAQRRSTADTQVEVRVASRENDPLLQRLDEVWHFVERDADGRIVREEHERLVMRWTYRFEMRYLLELCGFEIEAQYSDYERSGPVYGREQIWVARRP